MKKPLTALILSFSLIASGVLPYASACAQPLLGLPEPGVMVSLSPSYKAAMMRGVTIDPQDPFHFEFLITPGEENLTTDQFKAESDKLVKYFMAGLAIPEQEFWVNLSPYEKDRTIPESLSRTGMGRDLLAQDYVLKQITASLIYPQKDLGKTFWDKIYAKAQELYGTTEVPVNTFNKVWITADKAHVFQKGNTAWVTQSHLKVMLEEDYLAMSKNQLPASAATQAPSSNTLGNQFVRELILPAIEKEVNEGKNFAQLRQIYDTLILASWYKRAIKDSLLNQLYSDQKKTRGIDLKDPTVKDKIYQRYVQAYKKGVFNFIEEETSSDGEIVPRKYFSGGMTAGAAVRPEMDTAMTADMQVLPQVNLVDVRLESGTKTVKQPSNPFSPFKIGISNRLVINGGKKPLLRVSEIFAIPVSPEEAREGIEQINSIPDMTAVLVSEEVMRDSMDKDKVITLDSKNSRASQSFQGQKGLLRGNRVEILTPGEFGVIPNGVGLAEKLKIKLGGFIQFKVWDEQQNKWWYLMEIKKITASNTPEGDELNPGAKNYQFEIAPFGGGYKFKNEEHRLKYFSKSGGIMEPLEKDPLEMRFRIRGANAPDIVDYFLGDAEREDLGREFDDELVGPKKFFKKRPQALRDQSMLAAAPEILDVEAFKQRFPHWDVQKALQAPWEEAVRNPKLHTHPQTKSQINYFNNQEQVRNAFLRLLLDLSLTPDMKPEDFAKRLQRLNIINLTGLDGRSPYNTSELREDQVDSYAIGYSDQSLIQRAGRYRAILKYGLINKIAKLQEILKRIIDLQDHNADHEDYLNEIANFYLASVEIYQIPGSLSHRFIYLDGNNSMFRNMSNGMLRLIGVNGIAHGYIDKKFKDRSWSDIVEDVRKEYHASFQVTALNHVEEPLGGIDLNPQHMDLSVEQGADQAMSTMFDPALTMDVDNLTPVIVRITTAQNLPALLGIQ